MKSGILVCSLALILSGFDVAAQHSQHPSAIADTLYLSLNDVWERTNIQSKEVQLQNTESMIRSENVLDAKAERFPTLSVFASVDKATNMPIYSNGLNHKPEQHDVIHTLYNSGASMYFNLYDGNKQNLKIQETKILDKRAAIAKQQTQSEMRYKAAQLFLELQKSMIFKEVIINDIADQEKQLHEVQQYYKNGVILKSDVLRIELELSKRKMSLIQIENDILITNQQLSFYLGTNENSIVIPKNELSSIESETYEYALNVALVNAYKQQISEQNVELTEIGIKKVKANVRPSLGLTGSFTFANPQIFLYPYNDSWYTLGLVGLKASFPISSLYHNTHKLKKAKLELEKEEIAHHHIIDQIKQEVKEAYLRYQEALIQIDVNEKNKQFAKENARIIKNTYFNKTALVTDLLDADIQVLRTQFELEASKINAQNKYYLLQLAKGIL
ncbi:TolC family protein [Paenimyroides tangerinum]|uniref:TolC family protein n=1 Tax=Paenimyroides tangerinum TaxID=2488728 RepID=A0A3P3W8G4_9FLAO|nr:TolC family protein [Paenimyroides tangerinum]RRJ90994.1 TolC family protein [Paenimyroides tangerinum]